MILFLDTSSLVKLYLTEPGAENVRSLVADSEVVAVSRIAYPEMVAAAARRQREGDLTPAEFDGLLAAFDEDWCRLAVIDVDERAAARVARDHGLRGLDAIHLAAAIQTAEAVREFIARAGAPPESHPPARLADGPLDSLVFSTFDGRLRAAAVAAGLWVGPGVSSP